MKFFRWNWQNLELKHEEREKVKVKDIEKYCYFEQVREIQFQITGQRKNHQNMSEFKTYLEHRNLGNVFNILFGFAK